MKRWGEYFQRKLKYPSDSKFIRAAKIRKHRLHNDGNPVLIMTLTVGDEKLKFAIHDALAYQMVRDIRKAIGFSESELESAQWISRYSAGGDF